MAGKAPQTQDQKLRADVLAELAWRPEVGATGITVAVEDGTVVLSGELADYAQLLAVKDAALRVRGVRALVNDLRVVAPSDGAVADRELAIEVRRALRTAVDVPRAVHAEVRDGVVALLGEVDFDVQRRAAKRAVRYLRGVRAVDSRIRIARRPSSADAVERIENALRRHAMIDARSIDVSIDGSTLTLSGSVRSWAERYEVAQAAAASPHISHVENNLVVQPA